LDADDLIDMFGQENVCREPTGSCSLISKITNGLNLPLINDYLSSNFERIVIEDLNVKGVVKNRKLSRSIIDAGLAI